MPMLPSGRHVAITRNPLQTLLYDAASVVNVHKVLAICQKSDLYPLTGFQESAQHPMTLMLRLNATKTSNFP